MKNSRRLTRMAVVLVLFAGVPAHQAAAQDTHHGEQAPGAAPATPGDAASERQGMMKQHMTQMMGEMKAADAKLDALVQAMHSAAGPQKTDAIAAVVSALVEQHRAMHSSMGMMMGMMGEMGKMGASSATENGKPTP